MRKWTRRLVGLAPALIALPLLVGCDATGGNSDNDTGPDGKRYGPGRHGGTAVGPDADLPHPTGPPAAPPGYEAKHAG